jgi:hypothetical protein
MINKFYIHYRSPIKQLFRCVEKKITIDKLPKDDINKLKNASQQKLMCDLIHPVHYTKSG